MENPKLANGGAIGLQASENSVNETRLQFEPKLGGRRIDKAGEPSLVPGNKKIEKQPKRVFRSDQFIETEGNAVARNLVT